MVNMTGETRNFTIEANGKSFRALIDSLYTNKVRAVIRELASNARDSHIEAGQTDPFLIQIPTNMAPTFRVRDYGTGLCHEDMMDLYTTIFKSTKENTNDQTGSWGLGSKSPFAYTDTFQVTAFDGTEKRVYLAGLGTDGIPTITHLDSVRSSEPRGIEVSFPAKREDMRRFQQEMQMVALAYGPGDFIVKGMTLNMPLPRLHGTNWAIYPASAFSESLGSSRSFARMGSVVYPIPQEMNGLGYGFVSIIDIPIGSADVTSSRDALSMTDHTRTVINAIVHNARNEVTDQVNAALAAQTTRIGKAKAFAEFNGIFHTIRGSTIVSLIHDNQHTRVIDPNTGLFPYQPGEKLELAEHFGKADSSRGQRGRFVQGIDYTQIANIILLVDDIHDQKFVRKQKRIRTLGLTRPGRVYVLREESKADRWDAVSWIKETLELKPEQITYVSKLPDCPPPKSNRPKAVRNAPVLKTGQMWMSRHHGFTVSSHFGVSSTGKYYFPHRMQDAAKAIGFKIPDWDDIYFVPEAREESLLKRGKITEATRLDNVVMAALKAFVKLAPVDTAIERQTVLSEISTYNRARPVIMDRFFPEAANMPDTEARQILTAAGIAGVNLQSSPVPDRVKITIMELAEKYPLMFDGADRAHFESYIEAVDATVSV